ncbi:agmatine deiminase family protein [Candidatus Entotheonella palauensis]|nr:agmatine deiminase family protein [Candidatus Entotheonella palauensis]
MPTKTPDPHRLGYRMPAEWEPHAATWLAWPHNAETWPDQLPQVQAIYVQLIEALQASETVHLLVNDAATAAHVQATLEQQGMLSPQVVLHTYPTVDAWLRDSGPIFVTSASNPSAPLAAVDWQYTAWGGKYPEMFPDNAIPQYIAAKLNLTRFEPGIVLEGGSIDVNGLGTCLTTEQCLLNPNRNPHLQRTDIERYLSDYLGVRHTIWLGEGIAGDDTDGHIDDIARFVGPKTVVCALTDDPHDINYAVLQDNYRRLQTARDQDGQPLKVVPLPMPGPIGPAAEPLPASYANFYIGNRVVLVPVYDHPNGAAALNTLRSLFPTRRVLGISCEPLVWGLGAIHCITQQQPE